MFSVDFTSIIFAISFLLFAYTFKAIFFEPLFEIVKEREEINLERKNSIKAMSRRISQKTESLDHDHKLADAKFLAHDIMLEAKKQALAQKDEIVTKEAADLNRDLQETLDALESDEQEVLANSRKYVAELAESMITKLSRLRNKQENESLAV